MVKQNLEDMKHLTLILAVVLCTSSFSQAQEYSPIYIASVIYDSTLTGDDPTYYAQFTCVSDAQYSAVIHFVWSNNTQDILDGTNGSGHELGSLSFPVLPASGGFEQTLQFSLSPNTYLSLVSEEDGIYFGFYYDMLDADGLMVQSFVSSVYTWRFPSGLSTPIQENLLFGYNLYPNPTADRFSISGFSGPVQIADALGRLVLNTQLRNGESLNISDLSSGTYIVLAGDNTFLGRLQKL